MKSIYNILLFIGTTWLIIGCVGCNQLSKETLTQNINNWYAAVGNQYSLKIEGKEVTVKVTRYHLDRPEEKDDLIEITYKGMKMQLAFDKAIDEISIQKDSLQKHFSYISINNIYNEIPAGGWKIYPRTPQSTLRGTGVEFTANGSSLGLQVHWSTYTVGGYKQTKECQEELSIADKSVSEACFIYVDKRVDLEIVIDNLKIN